jgi:hypothetical protein
MAHVNMAHVLRVTLLPLGFCVALSVAAAAQTETMGETAVLNAADSQNGNLLLAQEATLSAAGTLQSLSFYVTQATGTLVLGVYTVTPSGMPGTLVAQTAEFTPVNGWNVASTTTNPTLQAGNYYLAYFPSSSGLSFVKENNTGNCYYYTLQFTAILPQTFNGGPNNCTPTEWSFYATLGTTTAPPTLSLTDSPASPSVPANAATGTVVTTLMASWSSGSTFAGTLGFVQPNSNDGGLFALNGNQVVVNGSLASLGGTTQEISVEAQQGSSVATLNIPVAVTAVVAPPPPTSGNDPTSGVLPSYNDAYPNWSMAGMLSVGGIPNRTTVCATLNPSGGDDFTAIQNAINSCPAGQVVQLGPGAFSVKIADLPIQISTGITLRGTGECAGTSSPYCQTSITVSDGALAYTGGMCGTSTSSETTCPNGGPAEILIAPVSPDYNYSWAQCGNIGGTVGTGCGAIPLTADASQGQTTIQVASTTGLAVGQWVKIDEASGAAWQPDPLNQWTGYGSIWAAPDWLSSSGSPATGRVMWPKAENNSGNWDFPSGVYPYTANNEGCWYSYCDRPTSELHRIAAIGTNSITFDSPLTVAFRQSGSYNAQIYGALYNSNSNYTNQISFLQNASVENLSLLRATSGGLEMEFCAYCWVRNVEVGDWYGGGINIESSVRSEFNTVYVHHCWDSVNNGAEYPIAIDTASTEILITNSITNFGGKGMVARAGGAGSVVSYSYLDDTMYDAESGIGDYWVDMGINASHYAGPHHVLFEGNWGDDLDNDNTHGNSVYITFFRNQGSGLRTPFIDPSIGKQVNDFTGVGYACGTTGPSGCSANPPAPLRATGPMAYNYWFAFVGNVLGMSGETTAANGWSYQGDWSSSRIWMLGWNAGPGGEDPYLDGTTASYIFRHGDYDYVNGSIADWTSGYSQTLPNSFYLAAAPSFFTGTTCSYPWPWVTPTGTSQIQANSCGGDGLPAKARWDAGTPFSQP